MPRFETFRQPPHSLHVKSKDRHLSIVERHIAMLRLEEEERRMQMNTEEEIIEHLMDWKNEEIVDDDGFPIQTRYQVHDSVPDVLVRPFKKEESEQPVEKEVTPAPAE